jgi:hypothetical protein
MRINVEITQMSIVNGNCQISGNRQDNTRKEITNVWNENQHGECKLSRMGIIKMKIVYGMWKVCLVVSGIKEWFV